MFKNYLVSSLLFVLGFSVYATNAEAKVLPQAAKAGVKSSIGKSLGSTISVFPKLRADRRALNVNFSNLQNAKSVSYMMVYKTNGQEEAAMGALSLTGASNQSSELLFGTCSKNVCRYHNGITDARLEVSYTSKTQKKYLKKFKIKV
ncbi:hypothetical protein HYW44_03260 [Candidatus Daviesbacteria bacterium]|nr:hypothetical protein [Candidatus Daviesbacteria bacterium]